MKTRQELLDFLDDCNQQAFEKAMKSNHLLQELGEIYGWAKGQSAKNAEELRWLFYTRIYCSTIL